VRIFCDFDGTISIEDATDAILRRFADPEWKLIEEDWKKGAIGSAECMQRQVALIRASQDQLDAALDTIEIDPSFARFARFCRAQGIPLAIVSDGVDYFIRRILARYGLASLPTIANRLSISQLNGASRYHLHARSEANTCASAAGVCKCRLISATGGTRIYIGDGRSDLCVADKAEILFAKGILAQLCLQRGLRFTPYRQFTEIERALRALPALLLRRPPEAVRGTI